MENERCIRHRIDWLTGLIASLSGTSRQLSLTALDLQSLALTKKHQLEAAIDRVDDLGDIITQLIRELKAQICPMTQSIREMTFEDQDPG